MCSCQKIGKKRIGKINLKASSFTPALGVAAGYLISKQADNLLNRVPVLNTGVGKIAAKALLGVFLSGNKRGLVSNIGTGMIVGAVTEGVGMVTNGGGSEALRLISGLTGTGLADESYAIRQTTRMNQPVVKFA